MDLNERLSVILIHLNELTSFSKEIEGMIKEPERDNYPLLFAYGMLDRLNSGAEGLKILVPKMKEQKEIEFSCGIILRSLLLDAMLTLHITNSIRNGNEASDLCKRALADGLDRIKKSIDEQPDRLNSSEKFIEKYSDFFTNGALNVKIVSSNDRKDLLKTITSPELSEKIKDFQERYDLYSKYDHFGILHFKISTINMLEKARDLEQGVWSLFFHIQEILVLINSFDKRWEQQIETLLYKVLNYQEATK